MIKKNSTSLHEALYRIKNWILQYEPSIVPFCEILSTPFITPLLNNIHSDNTLSAFAQPNLQVNKKKDLLEDILHKSLIAVTLPTENFNITHKLTNNIYPNNNILNLPNPFIVPFLVKTPGFSRERLQSLCYNFTVLVISVTV